MTEQVADDDTATVALAYALWDSENSCRMAANEIESHIQRAKSVRHWLRVHRHEVTRTALATRLKVERAELIEALSPFRIHGQQIAKDYDRARAVLEKLGVKLP